MPIIKIQPLSVNEAWQGKRFSTPEKKTFEQAMAYLIPPLKDKSILEAEKLQVWYVFGLSSKLADYDNFIKIFQDCLAKKYGFNDKKIYRGIIDKHDVPKGEEFIAFEISKL